MGRITSLEYTKEILDELSRLEKDCFGKESSDRLVRWITDLYDPEIGGFYLTPSAKETVGFLPDRETTGKSLGELLALGAIRTKYIKDFLPKEINEKIISFCQSGQSEEDGFWYELPWGKHINESKRLYQSNAVVQIIENAGGKPLYPTAPERAKNNTIYKSEKPEELSEKDLLLENKFNSKEDFKRWFEGWLDWNGEIYLAGSLLLSHTALIESAGYFEYCIELIKEKLNPETGFLDNGSGRVDYDTMSGTYKISPYFLTSFSRGLDIEMPYIERVIESTAKVILSDEPLCHACHVTNPWPLLSNALRSQKDPSKELIDNYIKILPKLLNRTREKLLALRSPDGIVSYYPGMGYEFNQRMLSALPLWEGETSGVCMTFAGRERIYNALMLKPPKIECSYTTEDVVELLLNAKKVEKIVPKTSFSLDFENYPEGALKKADGFRTSGDVSVAIDSLVGKNALRISSRGNEIPVFVIDAGTTSGKGFVFEYGIRIAEFESESGEEIIENSFGSFEYSTLLNFISEGESVALAHNLNKPKSISEDISFSCEPCHRKIVSKGLSRDSYHRVRVEYTPNLDKSENKITVDGKLVDTGSYYVGNYPSKPAPINIPCIVFRNNHLKPYTVYISDFSFNEKK